MNKITQRTVVLILMGVALVAMLALAAGLADLPMDPGKELPRDQTLPDIGMGLPGDGFSRAFITVLRIFMTILWACVPFYIIYLILSKEARKQFIQDIIRLLPIAALLYFFLASRNGRQMFNQFEMKMDAQGTPMPMEQGDQAAAPVFTANPPDWLVTVTSLIIALAITGLLVGIVFLLWRERQRRLARLKPLEQVAEEAQAAIDALQAGGDLRDVVMRCYQEMTKVLAEKRNLQRGNYMTPHEFEVLLQQRGLPPEPIHQLTQLFEQVRYGGHNPGRQDERVAISSLSAIVAACRRSA